MSIIDEIRNDAAGTALLSDWLGEGGEPVDAKLANWRGFTCSAGHFAEPCPMNVEPNWWDRVKGAIAETIRQELAIKHRLDVTTAFDRSLHMCKVCGCALPLKVHVPVKHVQAHTSPALLEKFPPWCWIRKELEQLKIQQSKIVNHG